MPTGTSTRKPPRWRSNALAQSAQIPGQCAISPGSRSSHNVSLARSSPRSPLDWRGKGVALLFLATPLRAQLPPDLLRPRQGEEITRNELVDSAPAGPLWRACPVFLPIRQAVGTECVRAHTGPKGASLVRSSCAHSALLLHVRSRQQRPQVHTSACSLQGSRAGSIRPKVHNSRDRVMCRGSWASLALPGAGSGFYRIRVDVSGRRGCTLVLSPMAQFPNTI